MRRLRFVVLLVVALIVPILAGWQAAQATKLDDAGVKSMLTGLGYEVKEPGTNLYEVKITTAGLDIPVRAALSKSGTKLWISVALLQKDGVDKLKREDLVKILEKNIEIGPCHFYIDGGWLKMQMALDNRDITPAILRSEIEYLGARIGDTKDVWQK